MKKVFYIIVLLLTLATLNSCGDYENKADIENQTHASETGHGEVLDDGEEPPMETGS